MSEAATESTLPEEAPKPDSHEVAAAAKNGAEKEEVQVQGEPSASASAKDHNNKTAVAAVAERLAFFFSDANIRQDHFIRKLLLKKDGDCPERVPIEALLKFNTIKQHTTDADVVVEAAKTLSDLLSVSEDGKAVGRVHPFTLDMMDGNIPVSLYLDKVPMTDADGKKTYAVGTDDIRELFQGYEGLTMVKLRFHDSKDNDNDLHPSKQFNRKHKAKRKIPLGAALVEFTSVEHLERASSDLLTTKNGEPTEPKKKLQLGDNQLDVILLQEYIEARKKRKQEGNGDNKGDDADDRPAGALFTMEWQPGCVIRLKGLPSECDREAILDAVAKGLDKTADEVKEAKIYVDYSRGQKDGAVRFKDPSEPVKVLCQKFSSGELEIVGKKVESAAVLEGDDESVYWKEFIDFKNKQLHNRFDDRSSRKKRRRH